MPPAGTPIRSPPIIKSYADVDDIVSLPVIDRVRVVAVGPAHVRTVVIGNQCQSAIDYHGQVCQTKDVIETGVLLRVELEGW